MSMVRFATICDHCESRSTEYFAYPTCRDCQADVCPACEIPGSHDPEFGVCTCQRCAAAEELCSTCGQVDPACRCRPDALPKLSPPEWDREDEQ